MNKLIVATGGTRGIGRAILEKFAAAGFDLATCARTKADLDEVKTALEKNYSTRVFVYTADVSVKRQVKAFSEFVICLDQSTYWSIMPAILYRGRSQKSRMDRWKR